MIFTELAVEGAYLVELEPVRDERGSFARAFSVDELAAQGLEAGIAQANVSSNVAPGTIRGLHWQVAPAEEVKIVRCTAGAIYDVVVDVRPGSPTHRAWAGAELTAENHLMLYVPAGCAHGFMTLSVDSEVFYLVTQAYSPAHERGARWDDPAFGIEWPDPKAPLVISPKDASWPDYTVQALVEQP